MNGTGKCSWASLGFLLSGLLVNLLSSLEALFSKSLLLVSLKANNTASYHLFPLALPPMFSLLVRQDVQDGTPCPRALGKKGSCLIACAPLAPRTLAMHGT